MKKFGVYSVLAVSAFSFVSWISPLKAHAGPVTDTMTFEGNTYKGKGGNSSGGYATYPYYFKINNATTYVPLLCVSFQDRITNGEKWTADVYTIGTTYTIATTPTPTPGLTRQEQEEDAYLDSLIPSTNSPAGLEELQWAVWEVGDPSFFTTASDTGSTNPVLKSFGLTNSEITVINSDYEAAENWVNGNTSLHESAHTVGNDPTFYSGYELFVPMVNSWPKGDGTPQSFIGPIVPEPSSLVLLGSGLLAAAGALYRRKRRKA
jgi:hypothetical protein